MGVRPPSQTPSSSPSGGSRSEGPEKGRRKGRDREFQLPDKKEEGEKKRSLYDIEGAGEQMKEQQQQISQEKASQEMGVERSGGIEAKQEAAKLSNISQLIQSLASDLQVGTMRGQNYASLNLKATSEIPEAFAGSNLTLSFKDNGLVIRFDNFSTPQQEQAALSLVDQNKEQLVQLAQSLQAKNIQLAELNIGNNTVKIPAVEQAPSPIQPAAPGAEARPGEERRQGQDEGGQQGGGGRGRSRR